jgi:hypothetical protein
MGRPFLDLRARRRYSPKHKTRILVDTGPVLTLCLAQGTRVGDRYRSTSARVMSTAPKMTTVSAILVPLHISARQFKLTNVGARTW